MIRCTRIDGLKWIAAVRRYAAAGDPGLPLRPPPVRRRHAQGGSTMIEVLVTIVVIAIGLLGVAALQAIGMKSNNGAYLRSQASLLVCDMADRLRADRAAALAGTYDFAQPESNTCNPSQTYSGTLAVREMAQWLNATACLLPAGNGSIVRTGRVFTISVVWNDTRSDIRQSSVSGDVTQTFSMQIQL
jgi:type IV pilus assembly protein PilV